MKVINPIKEVKVEKRSLLKPACRKKFVKHVVYQGADVIPCEECVKPMWLFHEGDSTSVCWNSELESNPGPVVDYEFLDSSGCLNLLASLWEPGGERFTSLGRWDSSLRVNPYSFCIPPCQPADPVLSRASSTKTKNTLNQRFPHFPV